MMIGMSQEKLGDGLGLTMQQVQNMRAERTASAEPLAAHLAYLANRGAVLLRRRTAATGAARGNWRGAGRPLM
jgi:transcriptional regulator with XRE-family HTH domain